MNPYTMIALLVVWALSLTGVGWWQRNDGKTAERSAWQGRENAELLTANDKIKTLEESARAAEHEHATVLAGISTELQRRQDDATQQRRADAAAMRAGTLRLRDPSATGLRACGGITTEAGAGAGQRDGGAAGELSAEAAGFLLDFANEADDVARQLGACQSVVAADRDL